jgi:pre-rRNA-processing protein TSR3
MSGALYIMNFKNLSVKLLSIYKWGETFLTLNQDALNEYSNADTLEELKRIELEFFPNSQRS